VRPPSGAYYEPFEAMRAIWGGERAIYAFYNVLMICFYDTWCVLWFACMIHYVFYDVFIWYMMCFLWCDMHFMMHFTRYIIHFMTFYDVIWSVYDPFWRFMMHIIPLLIAPSLLVEHLMNLEWAIEMETMKWNPKWTIQTDNSWRFPLWKHQTHHK